MKLIFKILFFLLAVFHANIVEAKVIVFNGVVSKITCSNEIVECKKKITLFSKTDFDISFKSESKLVAYRNLVKGCEAKAAKGGLQYSDDLVKAAQKLYPNKAGLTELHHITPKYLGGAANGPLVPLNGSYHQVITNEFRALWPYGKGVPSATELQNIMKQVYSKYPLPPGY